MRRVLALVLAVGLLSGCIPQLTAEEKTEAVAIRARYEAAIEKGKEAKASWDAAKATAEEMGGKLKKVADDMKLLYASMREEGVDLPAVLAELKELAPLKDELAKLAQDAKAEVLKMKSQGEEAAAEAVAATRDMKGLEGRVADRLEADGERRSRAVTWLAVLLGIATGGAGLKGVSLAARAVAAYRKARDAVRVLSVAIGTTPNGKADAETCGRINKELAKVGLTDVELEALRVEAQG